MNFKAVVQSVQYAYYDLEFDTLTDAAFAVDGLDPTNPVLPAGVTVNVPLTQSNFSTIMIQDQYGNPIVLELYSSQYNGGGPADE
jgi:hypothetical protein